MGKYFNFKKPKPKTPDRVKLIPKVDDLFSEVIRLSNMDSQGYCTCVTCGEPHHWKSIDCGHYMIRGNMATRWEVKNCGPQCRTCNATVDGKQAEFAIWIDRTYGPGTAEKLERLSKEEKHFSEHDLQGMIEELKVEVKRLKEENFRTTDIQN